MTEKCPYCGGYIDVANETQSNVCTQCGEVIYEDYGPIEPDGPEEVKSSENEITDDILYDLVHNIHLFSESQLLFLLKLSSEQIYNYRMDANAKNNITKPHHKELFGKIIKNTELPMELMCDDPIDDDDTPF